MADIPPHHHHHVHHQDDSSIYYAPSHSSTSYSASTSKSKQKPASMQVRLDSDLPDGISYAPDELASHNRKKRLFLPFMPVYSNSNTSKIDKTQDSAATSKDEQKSSFVLQEDGDEEDDDQENHDRLASLSLNPDSLQVSSPTDAASYAASIDMTPSLNHDRRINMTSYGGENQNQTEQYEPSISAATHRSTSSKMSNITASSLYLSSIANSQNGSHQKSSSSSNNDRKDPTSIPKQVLERAKARSTPFKVPPSIGGSDGRTPWNSSIERSSHQNLERSNEERRRINENGGDAGVLLPELDEDAWNRINDSGNVPGRRDLDAKRIEKEGGLSIADDGKSIFTTETFLEGSNRTIKGQEEEEEGGRDLKTSPLLVEDVFTTTPYPLPSRLIRRISPRQCLLLISGVCLTQTQFQTLLEAREQAQKLLSMKLNPEEMKSKLIQMREEKKNEKSWLKRFGDNDSQSGLRAGLGVCFSPKRHQDLEEEKQRLLEMEAGFRDDDSAGKKKAENMSRRLERPSAMFKTSQNRATLRAALAALEYIKWEEEGRDQIVIGTDERWLVEGISEDIFLWRTNSWRLTRSSPLGDFGDQVPDRDLWETLDHVIRGYENIDCNCRFWLLPRSEIKEARKLAEEGAMKDNQQPTTVRWIRPSETSSSNTKPISNSTAASSEINVSNVNKDMSDSASFYGVGSDLGGNPKSQQASQSDVKPKKTASQVAMEKMMKQKR